MTEQRMPLDEQEKLHKSVGIELFEHEIGGFTSGRLYPSGFYAWGAHTFFGQTMQGALERLKSDIAMDKLNEDFVVKWRGTGFSYQDIKKIDLRKVPASVNGTDYKQLADAGLSAVIQVVQASKYSR